MSVKNTIIEYEKKTPKTKVVENRKAEFDKCGESITQISTK